MNRQFLATSGTVLVFGAAVLGLSLLGHDSQAQFIGLFTAVPATESGLTHVLNSDPTQGTVNYAWLSPLADINNDGALDLMWYGHHGGGAAIWFGQSNGTFTLDPTGYTSRWVWSARDPIWWDLTGDGWLDGIGTEGSGGVTGTAFVNDGTAHFTKSAANFLGQYLDLDGDGYHEEGWYNGSAVSVQPKLSTWGTSLPTLTKTTSWKAEDVLGWPADVPRAAHSLDAQYRAAVNADLNNDNRNELIVYFHGRTATTGVALYTYILARDPNATGMQGWQNVTATSGLPTDRGHFLSPEDFDVDGDIDMVDVRTGSIYTNNGQGNFTQAAQRVYDPATRKKGYAFDGDGKIEWLDVDNNGWRDLILSGDHTTYYGVFMNQGAGVFTDATDQVPTSFSRRNFAIGDVDADYDLDIIKIGTNTAQLHRNGTSNRGVIVKIVPQKTIHAALGAKLWVYKAGGLNDPQQLLHFRQSGMERGPHRSLTIFPQLHVGIDHNTAIDVRVQFPSGIVKEVTNVAAKSEVIVEEAGSGVAPPSQVRATAGDSEVTIQWNPSGTPGVTAYKVYRSQEQQGQYTLLATLPAVAVSHTDIGLTNGTTYWYKVTAVAGSTESSGLFPISAIPVAPHVNTPPSLTIAEATITVRAGEAMTPTTISAVDTDGDPITLTIPELETLLPGAVLGEGS